MRTTTAKSSVSSCSSPSRAIEILYYLAVWAYALFIAGVVYLTPIALIALDILIFRGVWLSYYGAPHAP